MIKQEQPVNSVLSAAVGLANLCDESQLSNGSNPSYQQDVTEEDEAGNARIFPQRLYDILSDERNNASIGWLPHGCGFIIKNRKRFAAEVLPRYFKQTKYTSFTRKLNRWDFTRVTRGPELGAYYHKFFRRGEPTLCTQMYCKNERAKFATKQGANSLDVVPQLDSMPAVAPELACFPQTHTHVPAGPNSIVESCNTSVPNRHQQNNESEMNGGFPKIDSSLFLSPQSKMLLTTQMAQIQQALELAQTQQQEQKVAANPSTSTNAYVNAAVRALYQSNLATKTAPTELPDFSIATFMQQQAFAAAHIARAQTLQAQQQYQLQQQTIGNLAAAMPKLPPSQATAAQARMAQARRGPRNKSPSYRASAA